MIFPSNEKFEFISVVLAILTAVLILIHPGNAPAAIELDSISGGTNTATPLTFSHTIGSGSNRLLVVSIASEGWAAGSYDVTAVTYDTISLTKAVENTVGSSAFMNTEIWYLLDADLPSAGTYTVSVAVSGTPQEINAGAVSVTGAAQRAPEAIAASDDNENGAGSIQTGITTLTDGAWVFDCVGSGNNITFTPDAGQTEFYEQGVSTSGGAGSYEEKSTAGLETQGWTADATSNRLSHVLAAFAPAAIELDSISGGTNTATPLTFSHTIGSGSNRLLVVSIASEGWAAGSYDVTAVTYDTISLTKAVENTVGSSAFMNTEIWYLLDADSFLQPVLVRLPGCGFRYSTRDVNAGAVSVTGAAQRALEAIAIASDDNENGAGLIQTGITTLTDGAHGFSTVWASGTQHNIDMPDAGQTEFYEQGVSTSGGAGSYEEKSTAGLELRGGQLTLLQSPLAMCLQLSRR